jgi:competence protein ComEC
MGSVVLNINHPLKQKDSLIHKSFTAYSATVISPPAPWSGGIKYILEVKHIEKTGWEKATGKVLCFFKNDHQFKIGTKILIKGFPDSLKDPVNPGAFNYKAYLLNKGITHMHFVKEGEFNVYSKPELFSFTQLAADISRWYEGIVFRFIKNEDARGLVIGLILGSKTQLDPELKKSYELTGLAHILAVSGAHVAIIFFVISIVLSWMRFIPGGKMLFPCIVTALLWFYAIITGLTPPVVRATAMFTVMLAGKSYKGSLPSIHILFLSSFLILLFDPFSLFDTGFQLSVMAVLSIILFNPWFSNLFNFSSRVLNYGWEIISMTLAAQILTLPLIIYYFHSFPAYFIPANLISAFPALCIIIMSLALPLTSFVPVLGTINGYLIEITCWFLNNSVSFIASLPTPVGNGIYLSTFQLIIFTVILFVIPVGVHLRNVKAFYFSGTLMLILTISVCKDYYHQCTQKSVVVFHRPGHRLAAFINGRKAQIFSDTPIDRSSKEFGFNCKAYLEYNFENLDRSWKIKSGRSVIELNCIKGETQFKGKKKAVPHQTQIRIFKVNNSSPVIILDGSYKEDQINKLNLRAYSTWKSGAYISDLY